MIKMTKQKQLDYIYKTIPSEKNLGNIDAWDIRVNAIFIWDIFQYYKSIINLPMFSKLPIEIISKFDDLSKPINDQSNECIEYIFDKLKAS